MSCKRMKHQLNLFFVQVAVGSGSVAVFFYLTDVSTNDLLKDITDGLH